MIIIGIGSNLSSSFGDRFQNINLALKNLEKSGVKIIKKSSYYESFSHPDRKKPKFINIVASIETKLILEDLMQVLIKIEEKLERKRGKKNDPRTCDMDIIDYNNKIININFNNIEISVPHKNLISRNFVLYPLEEISPKWSHPITNEMISDLIKKLSDDDKKSILKIKKN